MKKLLTYLFPCLIFASCTSTEEPVYNKVYTNIPNARIKTAEEAAEKANKAFEEIYPEQSRAGR